jgi:hypothetical protein
MAGLFHEASNSNTKGKAPEVQVPAPKSLKTLARAGKRMQRNQRLFCL